MGRAAFQAAREVRDDVERILDGAEAELREFQRTISALPNANPRCPSCDGQLVMKSIETYRGWKKLWCCQSCGNLATLTDIPRRSLVDGAD